MAPSYTKLVCRYALDDEPVPPEWTCTPMSGWHGDEGRVIWSKNMTNGRAKGAQFERFVAGEIMTSLGIKVQRDLEQYRLSQRGDLIGLDGWLIECKRYANTTANNIHKDSWWAQTCAAASLTGEKPVLIFKYDRQPIRCVVYLSAINEAFSGKADTATIAFETWCMLVRESLAESALSHQQ